MHRWQPQSRTEASKKLARKLVIGVLMKSGFALLVLSAVKPVTPWLVYNASASVPLGYYRVTAALRPMKVGDLVLVHTPDTVRDMADTRRYIPKTVPMIKHIAAISGDEICAVGNTLTINGHEAARRQNHDRLGRPLPWWSGCRRLKDDEVFLLNARVPASFDGRYFGVTSTTSIMGRVTPL